MEEFEYEDGVEFLDQHCVCGSQFFHFISDEGEPVFTIDEGGLPTGTNGHPICSECGMDFPALLFESEDDFHLFFSTDLDDE